MKELPLYVGIDISRDRLDVALRPGSEAWQVSYNAQGVADLVGRLCELTPHLVVLEATGGMELALIGELASADLPIAVVNPRHVRNFARAAGKLAKTDALDAQVLAHFAEAMQPTPRPLPDASTQELKALVARRRQLVVMITAEKNRLRIATNRVRPQVQGHIRWLEESQRELEKGLGRLHPFQPDVEDQREDAQKRFGSGAGPVHDAAGQPARTGGFESRRDRRPGGCRSLQP